MRSEEAGRDAGRRAHPATLLLPRSGLVVASGLVELSSRQVGAIILTVGLAAATFIAVIAR